MKAILFALAWGFTATAILILPMALWFSARWLLNLIVGAFV